MQSTTEFFKAIGTLASYNSKWTIFTGLEIPSVSTADQAVQTAEVKKVRGMYSTEKQGGPCEAIMFQYLTLS